MNLKEEFICKLKNEKENVGILETFFDNAMVLYTKFR